MSYTAAIFYLDPTAGSDSARADLVPSAYANNGSGLVRVTVGSTAAVTTNEVVDIAGTTGSVYVGAWKITVIDGTTLDLQGSTYTSNPAAKGTCIPRGGTITDPWKTFLTGATAARHAPGDEIRLKKSPSPVSLGVTGKWTQRFFSQLSISATTNASPIEVTTTAAHGLASGDYVYITGHATNTNANGLFKITWVSSTKFTLNGSTGNGIGTNNGLVWDYTGQVVELSAALTKTVDQCEVVWTAAGGGDVTPTVIDAPTSWCKMGYRSSRFTFDASPQTNILQAYRALPGATDFSGFDSITLMVFVSVATGANQLQICLCSDAAGATVVDTFALPAIPVVNRYVPLLIQRNGGGALGNSIQSVSLRTGSSAPPNSVVVAVDNIEACNAASLHHGCLISKSSLDQGLTEPWLCIGGIDGTTVLLEGVGGDASYGNARSNTPPGYYYGTSETAALYKREPHYTAIQAGPTTTDFVTQAAGTDAARIYYSGGWNFSNGLQDGETFLDFRTSSSYGLSAGGRAFLSFDHISVSRAGTSILGFGPRNTMSNFQVISGLYGIYLSSSATNGCIVSADTVAHCVYGIHAVAGAAQNKVSVNKMISNNTQITIQTSLGGSVISGGVAWCPNVGLFVSASGVSGAVLRGWTTYGHPSLCNMDSGYYCLDSCTHNETTKAFAFPTNYSSARIFAKNYNGTVGDHRVIHEGTATTGSHWQLMDTTRPGGTGKMWQLSATGSIHSPSNPAWLTLGTVACRANQAVTVKVWAAKGHATQIQTKLVCRGGQLSGVAADVVATKADDTNWERLSITFTPTEDGVAQIEGWAIYPASGGSPNTASFEGWEVV